MTTALSTAVVVGGGGFSRQTIYCGGAACSLPRSPLLPLHSPFAISAIFTFLLVRRRRLPSLRLRTRLFRPLLKGLFSYLKFEIIFRIAILILITPSFRSSFLDCSRGRTIIVQHRRAARAAAAAAAIAVLVVHCTVQPQPCTIQCSCRRRRRRCTGCLPSLPLPWPRPYNPRRAGALSRTASAALFNLPHIQERPRPPLPPTPLPPPRLPKMLPPPRISRPRARPRPHPRTRSLALPVDRPLLPLASSSPPTLCPFNDVVLLR